MAAEAVGHLARRIRIPAMHGPDVEKITRNLERIVTADIDSLRAAE
ncbi:MAG: hypothetical protein ACOY3P_11800 [Planctomycetota bacterium]